MSNSWLGQPGIHHAAVLCGSRCAVYHMYDRPKKWQYHQVDCSWWLLARETSSDVIAAAVDLIVGLLHRAVAVTNEACGDCCGCGIVGCRR